MGSDLWRAGVFSTGTNTAGYVLNSVQLALAAASGSPAGFSVSIYTNFSPSFISPKGWLGSLSGNSNPATAGLYTYTAASTITLVQNTFYHIVIMAGTPITTGAYGWTFGITPQSGIEGWSMGGAGNRSSNNGLSWSSSGSNLKFAVNASVVPEPSMMALFGLGGLLFATHRSRQRVNQASPEPQQCQSP